MRSVRSSWQYWFSMMFSDFSYGLQKIVQLHHEACLTPGILARYEYGAMKEKKNVGEGVGTLKLRRQTRTQLY